jgi:FMN reductase
VFITIFIKRRKIMTEEKHKIKIVAIKGSVRPGSFTSKTLALVTDEIKKNKNVSVEVIDPGELNLPFPGTNGKSGDIKVLKEKVASASGVIFATPEYHGSFSSITKLVIENLGYPSALSGKPVALLGVAGGKIGAIKSLEQLRSICSHVGALVLPGPVSVAKVRELFDEEGNCLDEKTEKYIRRLATSLMDYIHKNVCPLFALEEMVREKTV